MRVAIHFVSLDHILWTMSVQSDDPTTNTPHQAEPPVDGAQHESAYFLETLRAELAEMEQKADEYLRLAQRTQAGVINYRRRVDKARAVRARDAHLAYVRRLLAVLVDFRP